MAGGEAQAATGSLWEQFLAYMAVVIFATFGGIIVQILMQGVTFQSGKVGPVTIPRALKKI